MKINDTRGTIAVAFGTLKDGTVFTTCVGGDCYMKIEYIYNDGDKLNAVSLYDGEALYFEDGSPVEVLNAELTIK